jgi:hypothetical protein
MAVVVVVAVVILKEKLPVQQEKMSRIITPFHTVQCLLKSHTAALQDSPMKSDHLLCRYTQITILLDHKAPVTTTLLRRKTKDTLHR